MSAVVVALPAVDDEMVKRGRVVGVVARPAIESVPHGLEVPIPNDWLVVSSERKLAEERTDALL